jgi:hypothetical protein
VACDPFGLVLPPDHEPGNILQEDKRNISLAAEFDEMRGLGGAFAEKSTPLLATIPTGQPMTWAKPHMMVSPNRALNSSSREPSTTRAMTSRMS